MRCQCSDTCGAPLRAADYDSPREGCQIAMDEHRARCVQWLLDARLWHREAVYSTIGSTLGKRNTTVMAE